MGKILNIRVMAQTYSEDDVAETWPKLVSLVWPQWASKLGLQAVDKTFPGYSIGDVPIEGSLGAKSHGVVELAAALPDMVKLGDLPDNVRNALKEPVQEVERANQALARALGDWDTQKASALTFELEDALGKAEDSLDNISW